MVKPSAKTYNAFKTFEGKLSRVWQSAEAISGIMIKGVWRETKVTPDRWEITYSVTKRRAGHAPEGSGAPVGTAYHWFILSHAITTITSTKINMVAKMKAIATTTTTMSLKMNEHRAGCER